MILQLKKWLIKKQLSNREILTHNPLSIEAKHQEDRPYYNDSSYFNGIDQQGNFFLCRMSFRYQRSNEHWLEFYAEYAEMENYHFKWKYKKGRDPDVLAYLILEESEKRKFQN